jgi:hypothetical protein
MTDHTEADFIRSITEDVMKCLLRSRFFDKLDNLLAPTNTPEVTHCVGGYKLSRSILQASWFDSEEMADIFEVMRSLDGGCDCEILYNVAASSRLKANYWKKLPAQVISFPIHPEHEGR